MVKKFLHKKSKRMPAKRRYKIEKRVRDHNKKLKKIARKDTNKIKRSKKDPGIPNSCPFKDQILQEAVLRKQRAEEEKLRMKLERQNVVDEKRGLEALKSSAERKAADFERKEKAKKKFAKEETEKGDGSKRAYYKEFKKVIEAADVVLEVLDARDPLGSRCPQVEEAIVNAGANKHLVLVLNKIDLIPKSNLVEWLKYLRNEFPTVAFKASTQTQRQNLMQNKVSPVDGSDKLKQSSGCLGANLLMKLLGNYGRTGELKTTITVGVVGFPNVGKSSIINSLKRNRVCNVGATPGVTKSMQEIQLDKHVMLLDSPGIVMAKSDDASSVLKNAIRVEALADPISPVDWILRRANAQDLMLLYRIHEFNSTNEFLALMAKRFGKLKKGGIPDVDKAARIVLQNWNMGRIKYFTHPPEKQEMPHYISTEIVQKMSEPLKFDDFMEAETELLSGLRDVIPNAVTFQTGGFTAGEENVVDCDEPDEKDEMQLDGDDDSDDDTEADGQNIQVGVDSKSLTKILQDDELPKHLRKKAKILESAKSLEGNQKLNREFKLLRKKAKKMNKKTENRANALCQTLEKALTIDEPYDFKTDYN